MIRPMIHHDSGASSPTEQPTRRSVGRVGVLMALVGVCVAGGIASAQPVILQWFEAPWQDIEHRAPDFFKAGYGAVWLPPPSKAGSVGSAGYDLWNRFDLGSPTAPTAYGTEGQFKVMIDELHAAGAEVYIDAIFNHNSPRQTSVFFQERGGYPGFWMDPATPPTTKLPTDPWGDFHVGTVFGFLQSEDPNGPRYDLHNGDLLGLIDIAQESVNNFIRHPVQAGDPMNIPAGTVFNKPDPTNARLYPDLGLSPTTFWNPGTARNPGANQFTLYPFNTTDPMQGDAVASNATGMLMRWAQWMIEVQGVDGMRLDATKHVPSWFWDTFFDTAIHNRRVTPDGRLVNPFTFGESVTDNFTIWSQYTRKDSFARRDALDLNGAGKLRDLLNEGGFGTWAALDDVNNGHLDNRDDGFNNGSLGVNHVFSHDNGSTGNGGSQPPLPTDQQMGLFLNAYILMRPGPAVIYHNARGITRPGGFWPREGVSIALGHHPTSGQLDERLTRLVRTHNELARGFFFPLNNTDPVNQSKADVLIFERAGSSQSGGTDGNLLVAVNDRFDTGFDERNVLTSFAPGTRLHELGGSAGDPVVDPTSAIAQVLVVDANRRVTVRVPRNRTGSTIHSRGFVIYGPALPSATMTFLPITGVIAPDAGSTPDVRERISAVAVITSDTFTIRLTTTQSDPQDPNTDDGAAFRIDQGFVDYNNNGVIDFSFLAEATPGYENFTDVNQPLFGSGQQSGLYEQVIDAAALGDGYHYISAVAFRHRNSGEAPLFTEVREVVYIDRVGPAITLLDEGLVLTLDSHQFTIIADDRTTTRVHGFWDLPAGQDPIASTTVFNQALRVDRLEHHFTTQVGSHGWHDLTLVALEDSGNAAVSTHPFFVDRCAADLTGSTDPNSPDFGIKDGLLDANDFFFYLLLFANNDPAADLTTSIDPNNPGFGVPDGIIDANDFFFYLILFEQGCP